jgi:hypothetical protein
MDEKRRTYEFLKKLHRRLSSRLAGPEQMRQEIERLRQLAKEEENWRFLTSSREHIFTRGVALHAIAESIRDIPGMTEEKARESLLSETFRNIPDISAASPARRLRQPFNKALIRNPHETYERWSAGSNPLTQSCPDFAIGPPSPYRILFEAKYFHDGSERAAKSELVKGTYQTFFYRALPDDSVNSDRPDWDYPYSCYFAYDASPGGVLMDAWTKLRPEVKSGFWEGANVYVMVLRGLPHS